MSGVFRGALKYKQQYSEGLYKFYKEIEGASHNELKVLAERIYKTLYSSAFVILMLLVVWFFALRSLRQWHEELDHAREALSERYKEKENLESQMRKYVEDVKAAHARAMSAMEEADRANRAKSEFLANMSHELRTPMNGIIGMADMLESTNLNEEQSEYNDVLRNSAKSLLLIVNDILDLSKIEAGSMELESEPFPLRKAITETVELFMNVASKRGIVLSADIARTLPRFVEGDEGRFIQILRNLLGNAIKFTDEGRVHLTATLEGDALSVRVSDTGIGIPEDQISGIFGKFTQANNTSTRRYGGTGLGLAITKQLVEMMGGEIGAESKIREGSTFWFKMRMKVREDIDNILERFVPRSHEPAPVSGAVNTRARILLVEDHPTNQFLMKRLLGKIGFQKIDCAENGKEALNLFEKNTYDMVFMDCQMPEMDGYEATGWMRKLEETGRRVPIIAMTANAMLGDRERCLKAGMDDYISKPVDVSGFTRLVSGWLPGTSGSAPIAHGQKGMVDGARLKGREQNENAPVNIAHLEAFTDGDREVERELFVLFSKQADLALDRLDQACKNDQDEEWRSAAHKFKGAAANLGAERLSEVCFAAETGFSQAREVKRDCLSAIRRGYEDVRDFLTLRMQDAGGAVSGNALG